MANTTVKMTKAEALSAIRAKVVDTPELVAFCDHELELLAKKSEKSAEKRAEKADAYNTIRADVVKVLATAENGLTVTDLIKAGEFDVSNQKMTYILKAAITEGTVTKLTIKGRTYYTVAK